MVKRCAGAVIWAFLLCGTLAAQVPATVEFVRDVQPILSQHCVECHGASQQMRGLRLDRRRDALPNRVGANGARIIPGNSSASPLYQRLIGSESGSRMPPEGPLRPEQIAIIKTWIDQGAEWPDAVSGDTVTLQPDPTVLRMMHALRNGRTNEFNRALRQNPKSTNSAGPRGWTPLMYAALYGSAEDVRLLLSRSANPNAQNDEGGTALMYAIEDAEKVRLLLDRGADPDARSGEGRTALLIAVGRPGSYDVVKLLLDAGASPSVQLPDGRGALQLGVAARSAAVLRLLMDHGAGTTPVPLAGTLLAGCADCFDMLLPLAQPGDLSAALTAAVRLGDLHIMKALLDRGAKPGPTVLQTAALSPNPVPVDAIELLIARGASIDAKTPRGTLLEFARSQGHTALMEALSRARTRVGDPDPLVLTPKPSGSARGALERSLPLLQRADVAFIRTAGCVSCHNNSLTAMTVAAARARRVRVDEQTARAQLQRIAAFLDENRERALENAGLPGGVDTVSYILLGMAAERYPADVITDAWARYVKNNQSPDGRWQCQALRPPLESSDFQVTAASIRSVRTYAPESQRADYDKAVARAVAWLERARPANTEDHVFKILGLIWGEGSRSAIRATAGELLALQRSDGGWGQQSSLPSDAYATGQALVALRASRAVPVASPAYRRGIRFLLDSQLEDGSWHVRTRVLPIQPYFDSDFPHGLDQFISAAATNWAALALAAEVR